MLMSCVNRWWWRGGLDSWVPSQPGVPAKEAARGKVCLCLNTKLSVTLVVSGENTDTREYQGVPLFQAENNC